MYTMIRTKVHQRMDCVREAFRLQRLAQVQRGRWLSCREHDDPEAASASRSDMLDCLRSARKQWREALGITG